MIKYDDKIRSYTLYILRCEQGKYYVGVTSIAPERRMQQHIDGKSGAYWTEKYTPVALIYTKELGRCTYTKAQKHEDKMVRACLKKYGTNNVRGGSLRDVDDYVIRFGYILDKDGWEAIVLMATMMVIVILVLLTNYLK